MSAVRSLLLLDAKGITRDAVLVMNVGFSLLGALAITLVGYYKHDSSWAAWFPFLVAMSVVSNPPAYGVLFGFLMVEEKETGVRGALAVTPVPHHTSVLVRSLLSVTLMVIWPFIAIEMMNATWKALDLGALEQLLVVSMVALSAPAVTLLVATFASNKVEALSIFKGITFLCLAPLALYFVPADAAYRHLFLLIPSAWAVFAFEAFRTGATSAGYAWLAGGYAIHFALLLLVVQFYFRRLYRE